MVLPEVSKLIVPIQGISTTFAASAAARNSSSADIVSIQTRSTPPSFKPDICSTKIWTALSNVKGPSGSINSPVGPTDPAIITSLSNSLFTSIPNSADIRDNSEARLAAL